MIFNFHDDQLAQQNTPFGFSCVLKQDFLETLKFNVSVSEALWVILCCLYIKWTWQSTQKGSDVFLSACLRYIFFISKN